ncbi:hypothetical protein ACIQOV_41905 [Kitasatospora sp. NPDC091257]|uniref:hypothetical protein n=1 Tax=Kitasatospora sp. NPDC091257 TaxID=3364084 RepID=UPI003824C090
MDPTEPSPLPLPPLSPAAEAAFGRGREAADEGEWERARDLFEEAVRGAGPRLLWHVVEACGESDEAAFWMRRAAVSESEPGGITVDPHTLPIERARPGAVPCQVFGVAVRCDDPARAVAALTAAEPRLMLVFEDGRELSPEEAEDAWDEEMPPYSPNYAAVDASIPYVRMDCKGLVLPHMARTVLRIVADELRRAGVRRAHLFSPELPDDRDGS